MTDLQFAPSEFSANFPANVIKLDNGLTLIHQEIPTSAVAVVDIWVRAGATVEPDYWPGMAHFLEHMIFKGTQHIPPGEFDRVIENRGGITNAATSYDYAHFFITTANAYLPETLPYLAELVLHPAIPEAEFSRERDVVLEEIRQSLDDPDMVGLQALSQMVYQYHPYGRSILGNEYGLMQQSPDAMRSFHHTHYQPENMSVVIVGNLKQEVACELVSESFQDFSPRCYCPISELEAEPPITGIRRQELVLPRLEEARLMMAWIGPGLESTFSGEMLRDACGLDLISVLLTEGRSSRLVRELREDRQLVYGIASSFSLQRDSSLFTITAWLDLNMLDRVEAIICDRLSQLISQPISELELARCKRFLSNDFVFSTEIPSQLAGLYGYYSTIARPEMALAYPALVQSLQVEDLRQLASRYLSPYHYAATVLKPLV
ncbi:MAG: pitrilysin family protein [Leptolyngbyaceae cyanobacterium bins.59]|nr:pitrilysin family protein [Leptolyngbyaceae cyanobacterium bins.59]